MLQLIMKSSFNIENTSITIRHYLTPAYPSMGLIMIDLLMKPHLAGGKVTFQASAVRFV